MDAIENMQTFLRKFNKLWNILLTSLSNHLNGKTRTQKMGLVGVLLTIEDQVLIKWILAMQKVYLSITLAQLKMKVAKLTQTKLVPF
jgi:hypothetical protein